MDIVSAYKLKAFFKRFYIGFINVHLTDYLNLFLRKWNSKTTLH